MLGAARFGVGGPDAAVVALAGFLVRGGILFLAIPSAILPTLLGLASMFNVNALGIDGRPTTWLISLIAIACVAAALWLAVASLVGSLVDVWLVRAALEADSAAVRRPQPLPSFGLLLDMAAIRVTMLLPVGIAIAATAPSFYDSAYGELTLPTNLSDPLLLRVAVRASAEIAIVVVTWLLTETFAAVAIRRLLIAGGGVSAAMTGTAAQLVRRPLTSLLTLALTTFVSAAGIALAMIATMFAFGWCLDAARQPNQIALAISIGPLQASRDLRPLIFIGAALLLSLTWVVGLVVAGATSAWRSAAWTGETAASWNRANQASTWTQPAADSGQASPAPSQPRQTAGF